jgi:hypothetical protein
MHEDPRAEAAILSSAEAYRLVAEARQMREERDAALEACKAIYDVQICMMMRGVHADFIMHEILEKHDVPSVQLLAKKAQDLAKAAIDRAESK